MRTGVRTVPEPGGPGGVPGPHPAPLNGRPDPQAVVAVVVVGDGQDAAGPHAVRKAEIGVGEMSQSGAYEVKEALPPDRGDLRTQHSSAWGPDQAGDSAEGMFQYQLIKESKTAHQTPTGTDAGCEGCGPTMCMGGNPRYLLTERKQGPRWGGVGM